ncbi:MAG: ABC transporter ATP-binding protein [Mobiluncus porci]|uniref:ABC transporter ATP-binding protein n=1 Tax=Mobiluncus porci TaxID=2652278 RepID=A0A7K0K3Z5_9ACTO|nr:MULTISPECIES: ABC transporter ATP-binding protein [Mobiluncus]MCI6583959.1 ABC transporter ATP-binding protein [Mobiluncus sp.]MDD7542477.1 ABC transporter ATP-binding protein [Mobiluncus porci]MDY5748774.1 ABC transporter ATP-binding protein [Mobiluncus porci]MST49765.1 ABC transporter ATP-binding protein [Mobiluncus porci]
METPPVLILENVSKIYGSGVNAVHALDNVSLTVNPGEFIAIMGPSGCGKSTLLNLAGALDLPTKGTVIIGGTNLGGMNRNKRADLRRVFLGFVFQDYNLLPGIDVSTNVSLPLELGGMRPGVARREALKALEDLGVADLEGRYPTELSGGQAQRVAIARAVVGERQFLLADEPTGALDSTTGEATIRALRARADRGTAVLMVTHESRFAAWADRTVFLRDGRIIDGVASTFYDLDRLESEEIAASENHE